MKRIAQCFAEHIKNVNKVEDVFKTLAECFHAIGSDIYAVCLRIDAETFEFNPAREVDRFLMANVKDAIQNGICGLLVEPNKSFIVTEQAKYGIKDSEHVILVPLFYRHVQYGIVLVVFPKTLLSLFEGIQEEVNTVALLASKYCDLYQSLTLVQELNTQHTEIENRLNDIVQNVVHGLIALDKNHVVTIFNKNSEVIFGLASSAVVGKLYREAFPEKIVRTFDILVESTLIEGSILDYEVELEIAPSLKIPVGISTSIMLDHQGQHQGIICICRDMSLTKEVNRLKELNEMKSEFVSMVSHELKNPIAIIKSSVETLLASRRLGKSLGADFETQSFISINEEINRLSQLINDILNLSRIEAGRVEVRKEPTNIERLMHATVNMFKIHEKTHPITIVNEGVTQPILLDPDKIKQVIINYVGNAVKYSPQGCPILVKIVLDNEMVKVTVSDKGIGIPADKVNTLFTKFTRVSTPETQGISGTGLGLAICQKIIELHRGRVWCESVYHEGTTLGFSIPVSGLKTEEEI